MPAARRSTAQLRVEPCGLSREVVACVSGVRFNQPGDVATVLRVLYLVFNEGYSGDVDLGGEAIRLTRQLAAKTNHEAGW